MAVVRHLKLWLEHGESCNCVYRSRNGTCYWRRARFREFRTWAVRSNSVLYLTVLTDNKDVRIRQHSCRYDAFVCVDFRSPHAPDESLVPAEVGDILMEQKTEFMLEHGEQGTIVTFSLLSFLFRLPFASTPSRTAHLDRRVEGNDDPHVSASRSSQLYKRECRG